MTKAQVPRFQAHMRDRSLFYWGIILVTVLFLAALAFNLTPYLRGPDEWRWAYALPGNPIHLCVPALTLVLYLALVFVWKLSAMGIWMVPALILISALTFCILKYWVKFCDWGDFKPKDLINCCKLKTMQLSDNLRDEVLYAEGFSRMLSGLVYAVIISLVIMVSYKLQNVSSISDIRDILGSEVGLRKWLVIVNMMLLFVSTWGVHQARVKEVCIIFESFALVVVVTNKKAKVKNENAG